MKIILEGPDNAGKTTLAYSILGEDRSLYFHPGGPPASIEAEHACIREQEVLFKMPRLIHDRVTCISQQVYNSDEPLDQDRHAAMLRLFRLGALLIYCRPPSDRLMSFEKFTWRDGETEEHKQKIIQRQHEFIRRYDELMEALPCVHYDFDNVPLHNCIRAAFRGDTKMENFLREIATMPKRFK